MWRLSQIIVIVLLSNSIPHSTAQYAPTIPTPIGSSNREPIIVLDSRPNEGVGSQSSGTFGRGVSSPNIASDNQIEGGSSRPLLLQPIGADRSGISGSITNAGRFIQSNPSGANAGRFGQSGIAGANVGGFGQAGISGANSGGFGQAGIFGQSGVSGSSGISFGQSGVSGSSGISFGQSGVSGSSGISFGQSGFAGINRGAAIGSGQGVSRVVEAPITPTVTKTITLDHYVTLTDLAYHSVPVTLTDLVVRTTTVSSRHVIQTPTDDRVALKTSVITLPTSLTVTCTKYDYIISTQVSVDHVTITHTSYIIKQMTYTTTATQLVTYSATVVRTRVRTDRTTVTDYRTITNVVHGYGGYY